MLFCITGIYNKGVDSLLGGSYYFYTGFNLGSYYFYLGVTIF